MLPRVIVGELNGVKVFKQLLSLFGTHIGFSQTGWASSTVHDAIIEASTGGDPRPSDHLENETILTDKHHVVMKRVFITGRVIINGTLGVM